MHARMVCRLPEETTDDVCALFPDVTCECFECAVPPPEGSQTEWTIFDQEDDKDTTGCPGVPEGSLCTMAVLFQEGQPAPPDIDRLTQMAESNECHYMERENLIQDDFGMWFTENQSGPAHLICNLKESVWEEVCANVVDDVEGCIDYLNDNQAKGVDHVLECGVVIAGEYPPLPP